MPLPENDTPPDVELSAVEAALVAEVARHPTRPLELALLLDRGVRAYALAHPDAAGGRGRRGRPSGAADAPATRHFADLLRLELRYVRELASLPAKLHHDLLLRLRSFRHGVTVAMLGEVTRMSAVDQETLAEALRAAPPGSSASEVVRLWQRQRAAGSDVAGEGSASVGRDEIDFTHALMIGLQRAYGARVYVERRNVGTVVKRDRSGREIGVFKASTVVGAADITGALGPYGLRFELELKMQAGRPTDAQRNFRDRMIGLGVLHLFITYDDALDLAGNVERGVAFFDRAIGGVSVEDDGGDEVA